MATSYTSLLGFALPVTGELSGTWGDVVNNSITQLVEDSIAGSATASVTSGDWTLTTTGSGAANQARCAILIPTGTPGVSRNIIAPSKSKAYIVDNQSDASVVIKGSATTGVTIAAGTMALVSWNGSDFVLVGGQGDVTLAGTQTLTNKTITGLVETRVALGTGSGTQTVNILAGNYFTLTTNGNTTISISNTPASGSVGAFILEITNGGGYTITYPTNITWASGIPPVLTSSGTDVLAFYTTNNGTTWRGLTLALDIKAP